MSIKESIYAAADNEISYRRRQAQEEGALRKEEAFRQYPELGRASARINYIDLRENHAALGRRVPDSIQALAGEANGDVFSVPESELPAMREAAVRRYEEMIASASLEEVFYKAPAYCPVCGDKGGRGCVCYKKILGEEILERSGLPEGPESLALVRTEVYPSEENRSLYGASESPRASAENCLRACAAFAQGGGGKKLLFISGQVGVGKTYIASALGREAAGRGRFVCSRRVAELFDDVLDANSYSVDPEVRAAAAERRDYAEEADLLIIDDLGIEVISGKKVEYLITLLDGRVNAGKETVITSNLGLSDIAREYGERLASRFADRENSVCLRLCGPDLRMSRRN